MQLMIADQAQQGKTEIEMNPVHSLTVLSVPFSQIMEANIL